MSMNNDFNVQEWRDLLQNGKVSIPDSAEVLDSVFRELDSKKRKKALFYRLFKTFGVCVLGILGILILMVGSMLGKHTQSGRSFLPVPVHAGTPVTATHLTFHHTGLANNAEVIGWDTDFILSADVITQDQDLSFFSRHTLLHHGLKRVPLFTIKTSVPVENKRYTGNKPPETHATMTTVHSRKKSGKTKDTRYTAFIQPTVENPLNNDTGNVYTHQQKHTESQIHISYRSKDEPFLSDLHIGTSSLNPVLMGTNTQLPYSREKIVLGNVEKKTRFSIGVVSSLLFSNFLVNLKSEPDPSQPWNKYYKEKIEKENTGKTGFDIGIHVRVMRNKFLFETGFRFARQVFYQDFTGNPTLLYPSPTLTGVYSSNVDYYQVPVLFGATFAFHRFSFTPVGGFHVGIMTRQASYQLQQNSELLVYTGHPNPYFTMNAYVKAEVSYRFHAHFSAAIAPVFLYTIIQTEETPGIYSMNNWSIGVQGGIFYHF